MKSLTSRIASLVDDAERRHAVKLSAEDRSALILSTEQFLNTYIDKFVIGAKTSPVPLISKPCLHELERELLDAWAYLQAHKLKLMRV